MRTSRRTAGFTLIELMIVVAIIGILAAIAIPKFADLIRKSKEGATKGNLGALRSAVSIYYGDMEGNYPTDDMTSLTVGGKYINEIPRAKTPNYHADSVVVTTVTGPPLPDTGGWAYVGDPTSAEWGQMAVNCTHTDSKGTTWDDY